MAHSERSGRRPSPERPPLWRDVRVLRVFVQIGFLAVVGFVLLWLYGNLRTNMAGLGQRFGFDFLGLTAGFGIAESVVDYSPTDSYAYAFLIGVLNTLKIIVVGILLASVLGLVAGVARLSSNWLVAKIAGAYIEIIRNTPLAVQLFFWYTAVFLKLPPVRESMELFGSVFLSQRGLVLPAPIPTDGFALWGYALLMSLGIAIGLCLWRRAQLRRADRVGTPWLWGILTFIGLGLVTYLVLPAPVRWQIPELGTFNFVGGTQLSPEYAALLAGLVAYTGAFIAEIVRGGILSVSKGQTEAARALGLRSLLVLRLVVLPQALRVIIPPVTSQYLNLAKNSSLAVVVGYADLFNVSQTILNQSGKEIEMILVIMASYLSISLLTSLFMNWYNRRVKLVEH